MVPAQARCRTNGYTEPRGPACAQAQPGRAMEGRTSGLCEIPAACRAGARAAREKPGKKERKAKAPKEPKPKKLPGLDAAAADLKKAGKPLNFKDITDGALSLGWKTSGNTPQATLHAAAIREIAAKGKEARFRNTERGMFEHTGAGE